MTEDKEVTYSRVMKTPPEYRADSTPFRRSQLRRLLEAETKYFKSHAGATLSVERHEVIGDFTDTFTLTNERYVDLLSILESVGMMHDHPFAEAAIELLCCFDV